MEAISKPKTKKEEAIPLTDTTAEIVLRDLLLNLVAKYGEFKTVTTDCGVQFESSLCKSTMQFLGCERQRTTTYNQASNNVVDRFHLQLKASLRARNGNANWFDLLPFVLRGIGTAIKPDPEVCPAELVYASPLRLLGDMISASSEPHFSDLNSLLQRLRQRMYELEATPTRDKSRHLYINPAMQLCFPSMRSLKDRDGPFKYLTDQT